VTEERKAELAKAEDEAWTEVSALIDGLTPEQMELVGYYPDWSVKDVLAHMGAWMAESVGRLEQIRVGSYRPEPSDTDAMNQVFYDANHDLPIAVVRSELWSARTRLLQEWDVLPEVSPPAEEWFVEGGAEHWAEHLPRLREWVKELGGSD
jgi:hypothetical protein